MSKNKPIEILKEEHRAIKLMLRVLEKVCQKLEAGDELNPGHLLQIVDFIRGFADRCHHAKEENLLFPAMIDSGLPKEGGPLSVMLNEHQQGRKYVREMEEEAQEYSRGSLSSSRKYAENAKNFISLLTQHIDKEDNILYEIARMHIPENKEKLLSVEFERVEREKIGVGVHEKYHYILKEMKRIYL